MEKIIPTGTAIRGRIQSVPVDARSLLIANDMLEKKIDCNTPIFVYLTSRTPARLVQVNHKTCEDACFAYRVLCNFNTFTATIAKQLHMQMNGTIIQDIYLSEKYLKDILI